MPDFIYLASQSPRRRQLLEQIGVPHQLLVANADDPEPDPEALETVCPGESAAHYVQRVTALKLDAATARLRRRGWLPAPVLCSDTTVALGRRILGKPASADDAVQMLHLLSGKVHRVLTAVALQTPQGERLSALSVSQVHFAAMTDAQITAYAASGEPMGKAGSYGVQGRAAAHIARIAGSYTGIMGLPLYETAGLLRNVGFGT